MINVDEKLAKNVKMKKIIEKEFSKKKKNFNTIMFEIVDVKNLNAEIFMKYHIDDTTTISSSFTKIFFRIRNFIKERGRDADAQERVKKKFEEEREQKLREDEEERNK